MKILLIILSVSGQSHQYAFKTKYCETSMEQSISRIKSELKVDKISGRCYSEQEWKSLKG